MKLLKSGEWEQEVEGLELLNSLAQQAPEVAQNIIRCTIYIIFTHSLHVYLVYLVQHEFTLHELYRQFESLIFSLKIQSCMYNVHCTRTISIHVFRA